MTCIFLFFFFSTCAVVLDPDKGVSMPVSGNQSGSAGRAPGNPTAGLSIEHVGAGDQESDTTSQRLPLGVASHPEWWSTRLQALTPLYHYSMEADGERPVRHVALEGWGLGWLDGSAVVTWQWNMVCEQCGVPVCVHWASDVWKKKKNRPPSSWWQDQKSDVNGSHKERFHTNWPSCWEGDITFSTRAGQKRSAAPWKYSLGQKPSNMYFLKCWQASSRQNVTVFKSSRWFQDAAGHKNKLHCWQIRSMCLLLWSILTLDEHAVIQHKQNGAFQVPQSKQYTIKAISSAYTYYAVFRKHFSWIKMELFSLFSSDNQPGEEISPKSRSTHVTLNWTEIVDISKLLSVVTHIWCLVLWCRCHFSLNELYWIYFLVFRGF